HAVDDVPGQRHLRLGDAPEVGVVLIAPGHLEVQRPHQGNAHAGRYDRNREFRVERADLAITGVVARGGGTRYATGDVACQRAGGGDAAVEARVAAVFQGLAPPLAAESDTDVAGGNREQVLADEARVELEQRRPTLSHHRNGEMIDGDTVHRRIL